MVEVGEEFWLEYPAHDTDTTRLFVKVLSTETDGGSFDVRDPATGESWTVFKREVDEGVVIIVGAEAVLDEYHGSFEGIVGDLDFDLPDLHVPDYSKMTPLELVEVFQDVKNKLADAGAMFVQKTEEEKDWRVQYDAILMEQRRRNR